MRPRTVLTAIAGTIGALALLRMQREARQVRAGTLRAVGSAGRTDDEGRDDPVHTLVRSWQPDRPATTVGRVVAGLWAAPLTVLGLAFALLGGRVPAWDDGLGAFVVLDLRGPFGWFLRQQGAAAATLGQVVVVRRDAAPAALLRHEVQHVRQQERLGLLFAAAYPLAGARWGYRDNPFEVAARASARVSGSAGPA